MSTPLLAAAIAREQWELAALCLILGVVRAADSLPPDAVDALLELLTIDEPPAPRRKRHSDDGRR